MPSSTGSKKKSRTTKLREVQRVTLTLWPFGLEEERYKISFLLPKRTRMSIERWLLIRRLIGGSLSPMQSAAPKSSPHNRQRKLRGAFRSCMEKKKSHRAMQPNVYPEFPNRPVLTARDVLALMQWRSRDTLYGAIRDKGFPQPKKYGPRCSRWFQEDVLSWLRSLPDGGNEHQRPTKKGKK